MMGRAACLKTLDWRQPGWKVMSKLNTLSFSPTSFWLWTMISPRSGATSTMALKVLSCYFWDMGLQRTATFTHYFSDMGLPDLERF